MRVGPGPEVGVTATTPSDKYFSIFFYSLSNYLHIIIIIIEFIYALRYAPLSIIVNNPW